MNRSFEFYQRYLPGLTAAGAALIALFWTATGETFDPALAARELPADVASQCAISGIDTKTGCVGTELVTSRWIGRTGRGDLFMVLGNHCTESKACQAWFVERNGNGSLTLLKVNGEIRLYQGNGVYPTIQQRHSLSETHSTYSRYEWRDDKYVRTEQRVVYRVDGVECGTQSECTHSALEALQSDDADSAVRILEDVYGVSWI